MSWFSKGRGKRLSELNDEIGEMLGDPSKAPRIGFNDEAMKIRGRDRRNAKETEPDQVIYEEEKALELGKDREFEVSEQGEQLAQDAIDQPFWKRLLN